MNPSNCSKKTYYSFDSVFNVNHLETAIQKLSEKLIRKTAQISRDQSAHNNLKDKTDTVDLSGLKLQSISMTFWNVIFWQWSKAATAVSHRNAKGKTEAMFLCAQIPVTPGLFYTILSNPKKAIMLQRESHTPSKILMVSKTRRWQDMSKGEQGAGCNIPAADTAVLQPFPCLCSCCPSPVQLGTKPHLWNVFVLQEEEESSP